MTKKFNFEARFFLYMEKPPETQTKPDLRVFNALKESYRRPLMNYPSAQINPAKVVSLLGNTINTGLNAVIDRVTDVFRMFLVHLTQCIPTSVEDTMNFERKLHQEVARKCLDPFMGEILQEAITSPAVVCKAEKVLYYQLSHPHLQCAAQEVNISLLGGSTARVTAPYILNRPSKGPGRPRGKGSRGTAGNGLYPAPVYIPAILEPKTFWISKTAMKSEFEEAA